MNAAVVNDIARTALTGAPAITASDVYKFTLSPFALWCDAFAPPEEQDELDDFTKLLFEQGREHEARIVAAKFPASRELSFDTEEEGFRAALAAMAAGAPAIHGAPLFWLPEGLHGRADVLQRVDGGASIFGSYHYEVKEIKLAKNIAVHHRLQGAFYHRILSRVQGYAPATFAIVDRDGGETRFAYDAAELDATLRAIRSIRAGALKPEPVHGSGIWPWVSYTDACAEAARDISLVSGIGASTREKLVAAGFRTVEAIARADPAALIAIRGIGQASADRYRTNARALVEGTHIAIAPVSFPTRRTEIFLDLEGTGSQTSAEGLIEFDYLIGALVRDAAGERYHSFVADSQEGEGDMFRAFVAWLREHDDFVLYHWHHYEVTHLKKLAARHGIAPEDHARLFGAMRDLYKDATGAFAFPTFGTSIKKIAPYLGFSWRQKDVNAMASIALYFEYLRTRDRAALQKVLDYNEDDCVAMRVVKDWLAENGATSASAAARAESGVWGGKPQRGPGQSPGGGLGAEPPARDPTR